MPHFQVSSHCGGVVKMDPNRRFRFGFRIAISRLKKSRRCCSLGSNGRRCGACGVSVDCGCAFCIWPSVFISVPIPLIASIRTLTAAFCTLLCAAATPALIMAITTKNGQSVHHEFPTLPAARIGSIGAYVLSEISPFTRAKAKVNCSHAQPNGISCGTASR